ncbi:MAG: DEAD/DEAH box helicase [Desulfovibrio sp.]|jgi:DEAD/DEAH box helicase domain-containing protein|nr:DEAD/DEAH box helicase [Desulfovibrio sp.]
MGCGLTVAADGGHGAGRDAGQGDIEEYVRALKASGKLGPQISNHTILPSVAPRFSRTVRPLPVALEGVLDALGISGLYSHQAEAVDYLRAGRDVVVATPTASGKSLVYTLPVLENFLRDPDARALFLFPLKALARDQLAAFRAMTAHWPEEARPAAAVYDGDTGPGLRKKIRGDTPPVLLTNPEMLHLSLLPHHHLWSAFFAGLSLVAVDEVHTYRGVTGSHMAQVFRRLLRVAALYGSAPVFAFCSATVGNPGEIPELLTGRTAVPITEGGAPQGRRHYLFMNPLESPSTAAIKLLKAALGRNLRTIVYCQSRRMTELLSLWAGEQSGPFAGRISAYRAGFLPEERREIERRMSDGELLAVISTSALELGIDVGGLDLCILVGYPGTVTATLQRGGRVGRSGRASAVILIAQEDALDQYIVRHAEDFFSRPPEKAVLNPENPVILERHLECAAAELALRPTLPPDAALFTPAMRNCAENLERQGLLLRSADGLELVAARKRPHRRVSLRGAGGEVAIETEKGELIGSVDWVRSLREAHPGSVYLHMGRHFEICDLDLGAGRALARPCRPTWFTRTRGHKNTEILSLDASGRIAGIALQRGRLRITELVTGYERRALKNRQLLGVTPLDLPPVIFESEGFWFQISRPVQERIEAARLHFMGAIHALEHAVIGILPLLVMSDRNDFGGISTPLHLQTGRAGVFVYDGMPGGAGLTRAAFGLAEQLFTLVHRLILDCPCELGCPSCVHSPKCGSGNRPIDKEGALSLLAFMLEDSLENREGAEAILRSPVSGLEGEKPYVVAEVRPPRRVGPDSLAGETAEGEGGAHLSVVDERQRGGSRAGEDGGCLSASLPAFDAGGAPCPEKREFTPGPDFVVLDVETRHSAAEVGGWHRADRMGVSVAVLYDSRADDFNAFTQEEIPALARILESAPLVIGFNIKRFDYAVLEPHAPGFSFAALPTLDLLSEIYGQLSYRISLDNLAGATLNSAKSANGLMALKWWKEGRFAEIEEYCRKDVALTRDLYLFGLDSGYLLFTNKAGKKVRVRANWSVHA